MSAPKDLREAVYRGLAHPVRGEARADLKRKLVSAFADGSRSRFTTGDWADVALDVLLPEIAGWDAHTAHAAAEVEQLKAALVETADAWAAAIEIAAEIAAERAAEVELVRRTAAAADKALAQAAGLIKLHRRDHADISVGLHALNGGWATVQQILRLTEHGAEGTG